MNVILTLWCVRVAIVARHAITRPSALVTYSSVNNIINYECVATEVQNEFYLLLSYIRSCQHYETYVNPYPANVDNMVSQQMADVI